MQRADRIDRRMLYWLARRLFAARTTECRDVSRPESMLVVRIDERVGNLVTLQSMIDALRGRLPALRLGLLCSSHSSPVSESLENVDRLHLIDKRWFIKSNRAWRRAIDKVRREKYQLAIDASAWHEFSFTHAALCYYSGAPVRIGYARGTGGEFHTLHVTPGPAEEHELAQRMRLLQPLSIGGEPPQLRSELGRKEAPTFATWFEERKVDRPRIGIWAGSRKPERRWPLEFYVRLARELRERAGAGLIALWGPGEESLRDELVREAGSGIVAARKTDIPQLAGLLRCLDLVVTNDTGPMHLSVALGIPTVCLFASGDPRRWGHPYPHVRNLETPGRDMAEVDAALGECLELLHDGE